MSYGTDIVIPWTAIRPGGSRFQGAKEFTNPDFADKTTYEERTAAGIALMRGILDASHQLGMSTALALSPLEFPKEFAAVLPNAKVLYSLESLVIGPGPQQPPDDPLLMDLVKTQICAYLTTYPQIDALYLTLPEFPTAEHHAEAWKRLDARTGVGKTVTLPQLTEAARNRKRPLPAIEASSLCRGASWRSIFSTTCWPTMSC